MSKKHIARKVVSAGLCAVLVGSGVAVSSVSYVAEEGMPSALASTPDENTPITFKDPNLKKALLRALKRYDKPLINSSATEITYADAKKVTEITAPFNLAPLKPEDKITDLSGLEAFTNLETLGFPCNQITDLTPLAKLTKLEKLVMSSINQNGTKPLDLTPLANLTKLKHLDVGTNHITDLSPIKNLTKLTFLSFYNNDITSIEPLRNLTSLQELYPGKNNISDISPLQGLNDVKVVPGFKDMKIKVEVSGSSIDLSKYIKPLDGTTITEVDGEYDQSTHIGKPSGTKKTAIFSFSNDRPVTFTGTITVTFTGEKELTFHDVNLKNALLKLLKSQHIIKDDATKITDVDASKVTDLSGLAGSDATPVNEKIADLTGLENFTNVTKLSLNNQNISSLEKIASLTKLEDLNVSKNKISSVVPLKDLSALKNLNVSNNTISDVTSLKDLSKLEKLDVSNNAIVDANVFSSFTLSGEAITLTGNKIAVPLSDAVASKVNDAKNQSVLVDAKELTATLEGNLVGINPDPDVADIAWTSAQQTGSDIIPAKATLTKIPANPSDVAFTLKKNKWEATYHVNFQAAIDKLHARVAAVKDVEQEEKAQVDGMINKAGTNLYSIEVAIALLGHVHSGDTQTDPTIEQGSTQLEKLLNGADGIKATENYKQADDNLKSAYDKAIEDGQKVFDKLSSTPEQVKAAAEAIKTALGKLNGDAKVTAAKEALQQQLNEANAATTAATQQLAQAQRQATADAATIKDLNHKITVFNWQIIALKQQAEALKETNTQNETKIGELNTQVSNLNGQVTQLTTDKQNLQTQLTAAQASVNDLTTKLDTANGKVQTLTNDLNTAQQQARVDQLTIAQTQQKVTELTQQLSAATTEKQQLVADNTQKQAKITELTGNITSLNQKIAELQAQIEQLKKSQSPSVPQLTPPSGIPSVSSESGTSGGASSGSQSGTAGADTNNNKAKKDNGDTQQADSHAIDNLRRLWGTTAYDTMETINKMAFPEGSHYAVLTTGEGYWDALSASGLAGKLQAPVLLTQAGALSKQTRSELQRLGVQKVYMCGGVQALSANVERELASLGISVQRIAGRSASDTANDIAQQLEPTDEAFLATSWGYEDALSVAPYNYANKKPLFLTDYTTGLLDENTLATMKAKGVKRIHIVGGTSVVPKAVEDQLREQGIQLDRIAGETAYDTSIALADFLMKRGMKANNVGVATGWGFADALSGATLCGKNNAIMLLADASNMRAVKDVIAPNKSDISNAYIFGGEKVVASTVYEAISEL